MDAYRITIAVPGYHLEDISIEARNSLLTVTGERSVAPNHNQYLYRGIGGQSFTHTFQLAEYVKVEAARLRDGLLSIELRRELPESMLPRKIQIEGVEAKEEKVAEPSKLETKAA